MGRKFSIGVKSYGIDDISGFKVPYTKLRKQWDGLKTANPDYSPKHPRITPVRHVMDAEALKDPRPDTNTGATEFSTFTLFLSGIGATTQLSEFSTFGHGNAT